MTLSRDIKVGGGVAVATAGVLVATWFGILQAANWSLVSRTEAQAVRELEQARSVTNHLESALVSTSQDRDSCKLSLATVTGERDEVRKLLTSAQQAITTLTVERDDAKKSLAASHEKNTELIQTIATTTGERDDARKLHASVQQTLTSVTAERDDARKLFAAAQGKNTELNQALAAATDARDEANKLLVSTQKKNQELGQSLESIHTNLADIFERKQTGIVEIGELNKAGDTFMSRTIDADGRLDRPVNVNEIVTLRCYTRVYSEEPFMNGDKVVGIPEWYLPDPTSVLIPGDKILIKRIIQPNQWTNRFAVFERVGYEPRRIGTLSLASATKP